MKDFNKYLTEGIARKLIPDVKRANNLIENSDKRNLFFQKIINAIEIADDDANCIIEQIYDILIELIRAKMLIDGYYASGNYAHEAEISYLRRFNFLDYEINTLDELRQFRNGIKYYGKRYKKDEAEKSLNFLNSILPKLKRLIQHEK